MSPLGRVPTPVEPITPVQPKDPYEPTEPVPAGFKPVAVVECVWVTSVNHGVFRIEERRQAAVAGLGRLLAALRERSHPQPKAALPACLTPTYSRPWFVLVSATGQAIRPAIPVGLCGLPAPAVLASLKSLHWISLGTVNLPWGPLRPPLHGGPIHVGPPRIDISPATTVSD
jgi:hypothetical protein